MLDRRAMQNVVGRLADQEVQVPHAFAVRIAGVGQQPQGNVDVLLLGLPVTRSLLQFLKG